MGGGPRGGLPPRGRHYALTQATEAPDLGSVAHTPDAEIGLGSGKPRVTLGDHILYASANYPSTKWPATKQRHPVSCSVHRPLGRQRSRVARTGRRGATPLSTCDSDGEPGRRPSAQAASWGLASMGQGAPQDRRHGGEGSAPTGLHDAEEFENSRELDGGSVAHALAAVLEVRSSDGPRKESRTSRRGRTGRAMRRRRCRGCAGPSAGREPVWGRRRRLRAGHPSR